MSELELIEKEQKILVIVWGAFLGATGVYLWLPNLLPEQGQALREPSISRIIRAVVWAVVVIEVGFLIWWKKHFLTKEGILGMIGKVGFGVSLVREHRGSSEERAVKALSQYRVGKVVAFAIAESFALYGSVLAYAGRYVWDQYMLVALCITVLLYLYPSKASLNELMKEVRAVRG